MLPDNYPPTPPIRLPIIGHAHYLLFHGKVLQETFKRYSKNGLLALHIGTFRMTLIGNGKMLKEIFSNDEANYKDPQLKKIFKMAWFPQGHVRESGAMLMNDGKGWQEQRKFLVKALKEFSVGQNIEGLINYEVEEFCRYIEKVGIPHKSPQNENESAVNIFHIPTINILWQIVAGERYDYDDSQLVNIAKKVEAITRVQVFEPNLATFLPILSKLFPSLETRQSYKAFLDIKAYTTELAQKHWDTFDPGNIRDFIDKYIIQIQQEEREESSFHPSKGVEELPLVLCEIFLAGMDTSSITLQFAILYMVNNPDVQLKVQHEIFDVIGKERKPALSDKLKMPYCEATVNEIQRLADITPDGVPHYSNSPIEVGSHVIPAGHMLMPSLTNIMRGDQDWTDPEKFNPDRFIENGTVKKSESFIPFGAGKRKCPGESLARAELFLFFVGIMQKFHFEGTEPGKKVEMFVNEGHLRHPNPKSPIKVTKI